MTAARRSKFCHYQQHTKNQQGNKNVTRDNTSIPSNNTNKQRQQKLTDFITNRYINDLGSGQMITTKSTDRTLRCFIQNPDGILNYGQTQDTEAALQTLKKLRVDIIILVETNRNWSQLKCRTQWYHLVKRVWRDSMVINTNTPE